MERKNMQMHSTKQTIGSCAVTKGPYWYHCQQSRYAFWQ